MMRIGPPAGIVRYMGPVEGQFGEMVDTPFPCGGGLLFIVAVVSQVRVVVKFGGGREVMVADVMCFGDWW